MFDLVVVTLSLVALGPIDIPVNVLRVLRAFRVLRLLGRLRALRRVVEAVGLAVFPVLNVFAVILLVASVCAFLALFCKSRNALREILTRLLRPCHQAGM